MAAVAAKAQNDPVCTQALVFSPDFGQAVSKGSVSKQQES